MQQSKSTPFKQSPSLASHLAQIFTCFTLSTHIWISYILLWHNGPKTNSPSQSVKVWDTGRFSSWPLSHTISINLNEDEINMLSNAIVDAFKVNGAKLYVSKYTEPGLQEPAQPTYPVSREVLQLINGNPNIVEEAKNALWNRYNAIDSNGTQTQAVQRNDVIKPAVETEDALDNFQENMEESITNSITRRQEYLEGLGTTTTTSSGSSSNSSSNTTSN